MIKHSLDSSLSFKAIARELQKDCTTISKGVRNHLVFKKSGSFGKFFNDCALRFECDICQSCSNRSGRPCKFYGRCIASCISYKKSLAGSSPSRLMSAKPVALKVDKTCRIGRTRKDYCDYISLHPDFPVVQIDSVEGINDPSAPLSERSSRKQP